MAVVLVIVATTLLAGACWAYVRRRPAASRPATSKAPVPGASTSGRPFAGVRIRPGARACAAARALAGEALLANEAPALPLVDCDEAPCQCAFVKLADRRDGDSRRWADEGISALVYSANERRVLPDRRDAGTARRGHGDGSPQA